MAIDFGPKLNLFINADINEVYYDAFRPFLIGFDSLVQATVISAGGNTAPSSPANGDAYIVGTSPTGTWAGHGSALAVWSTEVTTPGTNTKVPAWVYYTPNNGWQVWSVGAQQLLVFTNTGWQNLLVNVPQTNINNNWTAAQTFEEGWVSDSNVSVLATAPATNSANQNSPIFELVGNYWDGSTSQTDTWSWQVQPGSGTNPTVTLALVFSGSSGTHLLQFNSDVFAENFNGVNADFSGIVNGLEANFAGEVLVYSTSAATNVTNSAAPPLVFSSNYWNGSASVSESWELGVVLSSGSNPVSTLVLSHTSGSGSDFQFQVPNISVQGSVETGSLTISSATVATTATAGSETLPANPLGFWETVINGTTVKIPYYSV